jgi:hypothetical protein
VLCTCCTDTVINVYGSTAEGLPEVLGECGPDGGHPEEDWGPATAIVAGNKVWTEAAGRLVVPISDEGPRCGDPVLDSDAAAIDHAIVLVSANEVVVSPIIGTNIDMEYSPEVVALAEELAAGGAPGGQVVLTNVTDLQESLLGIAASACEQQQDCNTNGVPDECDVAAGTSEDCDSNGIPDECESFEDCNNNGIRDACDISAGTSADCQPNGTPDDCEVPPLGDLDCNQNGTPDDCDIAAGTSDDCQPNDVPDDCDIAGGTSEDVNSNALPDECEDCNGNGVPDDVDIAAGTSADCQPNGAPDECDIAAGTSEDANTNGVPDECEATGCPCIYDLDNSCFMDAADLGLFAGCWLCADDQPCWVTNDCAPKDWDSSGAINAADLGLFAGAWLKDCDEIDPTQYAGDWYCEGEIICPWPEDPDGEPTATGDFDADGDVDAADYAVLTDCLGGPGVLPGPRQVTGGALACLVIFDFDRDADVDLADFTRFQERFTVSP